MQVSKISSQNFGQIFFDNPDLKVDTRLKIEDFSQSEKNKIYASIAENILSPYLDIYVKRNGQVFLRDRETQKNTEILGNVSAFHKFLAALGYSKMKSDKHEHILH